MANLYSYEIGLTQDGMTNIEALATPIRPPKSTFEPYSKAQVLGDGTLRGNGWATASWHWDIISMAEKNMLLSFCPGASATVFIKTRTNKNSDEFKTYQAVMVMPNPEGERVYGGRRLDFTVKFQNLVLVV